MTYEPEITVLTATYNDGDYIEQAIESILNQTYESFEYIIIDDSSTDNTSEILKFYASQDSRISVFRNPRRLGRGAARNRGLALAKGKWLAVFDGDDVSHPERLERQWLFLSQNPDIDYLGTGCTQIDKQTGEKLRDRKFSPLPSHCQIMWQLCFDFPLHHSSTIGRREIYLSNGGYPTHLPVCEDIFLWMKMALNGACFANLSEQLLTYRVNTRPNYYALNQAIAEQLHRSFIEILLDTQISTETFALLWETNSAWLYIPKEQTSATHAIESVRVLTQLYDYFLDIFPSKSIVKEIQTDIMKRITKITQVSYRENQNWVSSYHYGYKVE